MNNTVNITSEIGKLNTVIIHTPGQEVENMTPANAEKALYSDILNLPISKKEHSFFEGVLSKVAKTYQLKDLLVDVLNNESVRKELVESLYVGGEFKKILPELYKMDSKILGGKIIEGLEIVNDSLTNFLKSQRYRIQPLHNFFFMRDASVSIGNDVLISKMAGLVRRPETSIMKVIFENHPAFNTNTINIPSEINSKQTLIEGGDVHIAREDILLIGMGARTNSQGIDSLVDYYKNINEEKHFVIQELPLTPESFIHLDMVFTLLDKDKCMVYEPVMFNSSELKTIHIHVKDGKIKSISERKNIIAALEELNMHLTPVICGGADEWNQEREQWHSGANFFSFAPGKVLGYARNVNTVEQMNNAGFDIITAADVVSGKDHPDKHNKCFVTVEGSELARGGGGARCMTMPVNRENVNW
ncbi:MAG: arginine deiminase [Bacteroidales bacterium]|nr:arginine deiminase [Bacteroidales bacterium]